MSKAEKPIVEEVDIEGVFPDPNNARKHNDKNLTAIMESLKRFGQQKPIVVDVDNIIRSGNGTVQAAKELGWKKILVQRSKLSGSEAAAFAIADNRTSELGEWNEDILQRELDAMDAEFRSAMGFADEPEAGSLDPVTIEPLEIKKPIEMAWFLVGVPIEDMGGVSEHIEALSEWPSTIVSSTVK